MEITWHGKPGWRNKGHEIEHGTAGVPGRDYYFSLCGHRDDDPHFRVWVYCEKGFKHLGPDDGFEDAESAKAFADSWTDETVATTA